MKFDVLKIMKSIPVEVASRIDSIDVIDECIKKVIHEYLTNDSMKPYVMQEANEQILEVTSYQPSHRTSRFESLSREDDPKDTTSSEEVNVSIDVP